jgi:hypothetical protein
MALEACRIEPNTDKAAPQNTNSALWNWMIAPFTRLVLFAFLWYQGEANTSWNGEHVDPGLAHHIRCTHGTLRFHPVVGGKLQ